MNGMPMSMMVIFVSNTNKKKVKPAPFKAILLSGFIWFAKLLAVGV